MASSSVGHADYGFDAPLVPLLLGAASVGLLVVGLLTSTVGMVIGGLLTGLSAASFVYTTRRGKLSLWTRLLDDLDLRGDERLLDVGCGRGAVLLMAAKRLPNGRIAGIDLWRTADQSGNSQATTLRNAELEGVGGRVELHTGDMTKLPFDPASFDVVLSSLAIHNVKGEAGRQTAIDEALRVLRPGGRLVIADIQAAPLYATRLRQLGLSDVVLRNLGWRGWFGGPWMSTRAVTASKPLPS